MLKFTQLENGLAFSVKVIPRASKSEITGLQDGSLRVRVAAPPVAGAANEELVKILAKALKVSPRNVSITSGQTAKIKQIRVTGASLQVLQNLSTK